MTFNRLARTKQLCVSLATVPTTVKRSTYYALGKLKPIVAITSAIHIVADRLTPTRQCTKVAVFSSFPFPKYLSV